jgi:hypothetical protein
MITKESFRRRWIHHGERRERVWRHGKPMHRIVMFHRIAWCTFMRHIHHRIHERRWRKRKGERKHKGVERLLVRC